jgi:hypothetical protein
VSGRTAKEIWPDLHGVVLQDGYVDRITGPRCMAKMSDGPNCGLYQIVHTKEVLSAGANVLIDGITGHGTPSERPSI